ncbi:MAG TPA: DUF58 domain-containing protein [Polyangiaceae bacterium]|nr:DUF58 domain-containing protein [Polyangiaceae bacterium]
MQIHPTRSAVHLCVAGSLAVLCGVALDVPAVIAWAGAIVVGLGVARAVTWVSVARIRTAGFEMLWRGSPRVRRLARRDELMLEAELRNRDVRAARFVDLRPVASPDLEVEVKPTQGEVPAGGRISVELRVSARRVGYHAIHGLSLELEAGPGLFEVPLTFANPLGLEVLPKPHTLTAHSARGARSRRMADLGRARPLSGESSELRELREHQAGDPFRRIAWKASARRGRLLVREYEREEQDVVFILLDAAIELYAGKPGQAPLDRAIDEVASLAIRHLNRGDPVGLGVIGRRALAWLPPKRGAAQIARILEALAHSTSPVHADRSALEEGEVALRVLEHMRPLDPEVAGNVGPYELDRIARRADKLKPRAPFPAATPFAPTPRERSLRSYLWAFGLGSQARTGPERLEVDEQLIRALSRARAERPQPSLVYLCTPAPEGESRRRLVDEAAKKRGQRSSLIWLNVPSYAGFNSGPGFESVVARTLLRRAQNMNRVGERTLRQRGIQVAHLSGEDEREKVAEETQSDVAASGLG